MNVLTHNPRFEANESHRRIAGMVTIGTVIEVNPEEATARVAIGEEYESTWLNVMPVRAGKARFYAMPALDEQVLILSPSGELALGMIACSLNQNAFPVPESSADMLALHCEDGAVLRYDMAAHHLEVVLPEGGTAQLEASGGISITGDITLDGNITMTGELAAEGEITSEADVKAGSISLKNHKHSGVQSGGSQTGAPL